MFELPPPREVQIGWVFCWLMLGSSQFEKTNMFTRCVGITLHMINIRSSKQTNKKLTQDQPPTAFFKQKHQREGPVQETISFHPISPTGFFQKIMGQPPKSSHLFIGFSIMFTIHFGGFPTPIFGSTPNWTWICLN